MHEQEIRKQLSGNALNAVSAGANMPQRTPEVRTVLGDIYGLAERFESLANRIHERLHCVSADQPPQPDNNAKMQVVYSAPLANELDGIYRRLRDTVNGLENLYERLEL